MIGTGAAASRSIGLASEPSVLTSSSWTIFTTIWPGVTDLMHVDADRALLHLLDEGARHFERHVGLEQRAAHLAHRLVDVGLGQRAAPRQAVEHSGQAIRQVVEHRAPSGRGRPDPNTFGARGRIALSGGCLRPPGPVGGSRISRLYRERDVIGPIGARSQGFRRLAAGRAGRYILTSQIDWSKYYEANSTSVAKAQFAELLDQVERGETDRHHPARQADRPPRAGRGSAAGAV